MFGFEVVDVVIGLVLVYLLLSLFATALHEYLAAVFSLRGKELARGLGRLLDDLDEHQALARARDGIGTKLTTQANLLTEQLYNHPLIRPLATRQGRITRWWRRVRRLDGAPPPRLPSYIPARTFALALLDVLGIDRKDASLAALLEDSANGTSHESAADAFRAARVAFDRAQAAVAAEAGSDARAKADARAVLEQARIALSRARMAHVLSILKQQSSLDLTEHLAALAALPNAERLPADLQAHVAGLLTGAQTQLQKLHDGVEVWFNNAMDRVSGAYKRTAQGWLFVIGLLIAAGMNADTVDMWRRLQANDELRAAMVRRAEATVAVLDSTRRTAPPAPAQSTAPADSPGVATRNTQSDSDTTALGRARATYDTARARLDSMELTLGWTRDEAVRVGLLRRDLTEDTVPRSSKPRGQAGGATSAADFVAPKLGWVPAGYDLNPLFPFTSQPGFFKLLGLLLTAVAISLGAPFWFDLLNKVISIRAAGRSPEERPKRPQAPAKRIAERAPR